MLKPKGQCSEERSREQEAQGQQGRQPHRPHRNQSRTRIEEGESLTEFLAKAARPAAFSFFRGAGPRASRCRARRRRAPRAGVAILPGRGRGVDLAGRGRRRTSRFVGRRVARGRSQRGARRHPPRASPAPRARPHQRPPPCGARRELRGGAAPAPGSWVGQRSREGRTPRLVAIRSPGERAAVETRARLPTRAPKSILCS